jgi:hypothetical protein
MPIIQMPPGFDYAQFISDLVDACLPLLGIAVTCACFVLIIKVINRGKRAV